MRRTTARWLTATLIVWNIPGTGGSESAKAQWVQSNGPWGGSVTSLVLNAGTMFAGTENGGVYRRKIDRPSWELTSNGLPLGGRITSLLATEGVLFAGTSHGVFRSGNGGDLWTEASSGLNGAFIHSLASMPAETGGVLLFANAGFSGIYRSADGGKTWLPARAGLPESAFVTSLHAHESLLFAGTAQGVYVSMNSGEQWTPTGEPPLDAYVTSVASVSLFGGNVQFFAGTYAGVFTSSDLGNSWTPVNQGLSDPFIVNLVGHGTSVVALTRSGPYLTEDLGLEWRGINAGLANRYAASLVFIQDENVESLYIGTGGLGILVSRDRGRSWVEDNEGLTASSVASLAVGPDGKDLFAGTAGGLFRSLDGGTTWEHISHELPVSSITSVTTTSERLYISFFGDGVYRSDDNASSWSRFIEGLGSGLVTTLWTSAPELIAGTYGGGVFRSAKDGHRWTESNTGLSGPLVTAITGRNDTLFAGSDYNGGIFVSVSGGVEWTHTGTSPQFVNALHLVGENLLLGSMDGVHVSQDHGITWKRTLDVDGWAFATTEHYVVTGTSSGVFLSSDSGETWKDVGAGLSAAVRSLVVHNGMIVAGTNGRGIWYRPLADIITSIEKPLVPANQGFVLNQNFPNPFNPSTTITYALSATSRVRLEVFDILGRTVAVIVDGERPRGSHHAVWTAPSASGAFFYRLTVEPLNEPFARFEATRRMILLR